MSFVCTMMVSWLLVEGVAAKLTVILLTAVAPCFGGDNASSNGVRDGDTNLKRGMHASHASSLTKLVLIHAFTKLVHTYQYRV